MTSVITSLYERLFMATEKITRDYARNGLEREKDALLDMQKQQLIDGQTSEGTPITPSYTQDPFFKSSESAERYIVMKERKFDIPSSSVRNRDTPNLYITGRFHSELGVEFQATQFKVYGLTPYASGIMSKYGDSIFNLSPDNREKLMREKVMPYIEEQIRSEINAR